MGFVMVTPDMTEQSLDGDRQSDVPLTLQLTGMPLGQV
jgi:hypothetical protein